MTEQEYELMNGAALAYYGDCVYEQYVRKHVIDQGQTNPNQLHRAAVKYVAAPAQAMIMKTWLSQEGFLSDKEIDMYKRGRNNKANTKAKNASIGDYRQATGFESLIGWLFLTKQEARGQALIEAAIQLIEKEGQ